MKKLSLLLLLLGVVAGVNADPVLFWGSDNAFFGGSGNVVYTNGVAISNSDGFLVELVNSSNGQTLYSTTSGFLAGDGFFFDTPDATGWGGFSVKTVIYNAPTKEAAGLFAEFSAPITIPDWSSDPAPPAVFEYNAGSVVAGDWQAIPEPAVASLIGIFGGGLFFVKRRFAKKQS
jgi:hypothetical protein